MQNQQIPIITAEYIMSLHTMLEHLIVKVEEISSTLEKIAVPVQAQTPPAPDRLEVSLSFLAAAIGASKSTIERRIAANNLPKPRANPDNKYRFWFRSDLPKGLHDQIDAHYNATRASR